MVLSCNKATLHNFFLLQYEKTHKLSEKTTLQLIHHLSLSIRSDLRISWRAKDNNLYFVLNTSRLMCTANCSGFAAQNRHRLLFLYLSLPPWTCTSSRMASGRGAFVAAEPTDGANLRAVTAAGRCESSWTEENLSSSFPTIAFQTNAIVISVTNEPFNHFQSI